MSLAKYCTLVYTRKRACLCFALSTDDTFRHNHHNTESLRAYEFCTPPLTSSKKSHFIANQSIVIGVYCIWRAMSTNCID